MRHLAVLSGRGALPTAKPSHHSENPDGKSTFAILLRRFPEQTWLTVPQVADCLHLSVGHIYNLHSAGQLPFAIRKTGSGRLRVSLQVLAKYMDAQQALAHQCMRPTRGPRLRWMREPGVELERAPHPRGCVNEDANADR